MLGGSAILDLIIFAICIDIKCSAHWIIFLHSQFVVFNFSVIESLVVL